MRNISRLKQVNPVPILAPDLPAKERERETQVDKDHAWFA